METATLVHSARESLGRALGHKSPASLNALGRVLYYRSRDPGVNVAAWLAGTTQLSPPARFALETIAAGMLTPDAIARALPAGKAADDALDAADEADVPSVLDAPAAPPAPSLRDRQRAAEAKLRDAVSDAFAATGMSFMWPYKPRPETGDVQPARFILAAADPEETLGFVLSLLAKDVAAARENSTQTGV